MPLDLRSRNCLACARATTPRTRRPRFCPRHRSCHDLCPDAHLEISFARYEDEDAHICLQGAGGFGQRLIPSPYVNSPLRLFTLR
jgi:hypothetical protein